MTPVAEGIAMVPVRTPTLPPATHTNTYVVGEGALSVFDPASPYEDEQLRLNTQLAARLDAGEHLEQIVLTHHHQDHVSGALALQARFSTDKHRVPIIGHAANVPILPPELSLDGTWLDADTRDCGGRRITAHHTPGHAPGHLVFQDGESGAMIAGDMVAGVGTILIAPGDGDLHTYLASLDAMRALAPSVLLPAHGPAMPAADQVLAFYIAHRHGRTDQIRQALDKQGDARPMHLVPLVYGDTIPEEAYPFAAIQILSHLRWLEAEGVAAEIDGMWRHTP